MVFIMAAYLVAALLTIKLRHKRRSLCFLAMSNKIALSDAKKIGFAA